MYAKYMFRNGHINGYQDLGSRGFLSHSGNMLLQYRQYSLLLFNFLPLPSSLIILFTLRN
jgi:hypothetical protein